MRGPILLLITIYSICMIGMVLVPGLPDENGNPTYMSFFHAYYFLAYTATTTGFGELPTEFSNAQRLWALISLYISVLAWLYAVGKIITLVQNPFFLESINEARFARVVRKIREPFYLVCGFGDTGSLLLRGFSDSYVTATVLDKDPERIKALNLRDYTIKMPGLCADASVPRYLLDAGIEHSNCVGVIALTNEEDVNLKVAVSARLLRPDMTIICRSLTKSNEEEMLAVGGDIHVVDAFRAFANYMSMIVYSPTMHTLSEWLSRARGVMLDRSFCPPHGTWILCGFGRMGRVVNDELMKNGIPTMVIEPDMMQAADAQGNLVLGRANAETMREAGIESAIGVLAGTNDDTYNLNILHGAKRLNPNIFTVVRQNHHRNEVLFRKANIDFIMHPTMVTARLVLFIITAPLMKVFFAHLREMFATDHNSLADVIARLHTEVGGTQPIARSITISSEETPAITRLTSRGIQVTLGDICKNPTDRLQNLRVVPLVLQRGDEMVNLPTTDYVLQPGDYVLFCMNSESENLFESNLFNEYTLIYLMTGEDVPRSTFFRWLHKKRGQPVLLPF